MNLMDTFGLTGGDILQAAAILGGGLMFMGVMKTELKHLSLRLHRIETIIDKYISFGDRT